MPHAPPARPRTKTAVFFGGRVSGGAESILAAASLKVKHSLKEFIDQPILHPSSRLLRVWDSITACFVIFLCIEIPVDVAFYWWNPQSLELFVEFLDYWFMIDMVIRFRSGFIDKGVVVLDPAHIRDHYLKGWFLIDFVGTLPFKWFSASSSTSKKTVKLLKYFKVPKLL